MCSFWLTRIDHISSLSVRGVKIPLMVCSTISPLLIPLCNVWQVINSKKSITYLIFFDFKKKKEKRDVGLFFPSHSSVLKETKWHANLQISPHCWQKGGMRGDSCLHVPQLVLTQCILIHPEVESTCPSTAPTIHFEKLSLARPLPFSSNCSRPFSPTSAHKFRVNPKAAAPLPWMSPNPFT